MSALLSQTELHKLTGYARVTAQAGWLKDHGIPHRLVDGRRLLVSDTHVQAWLEGRTVVHSTGLNLAGIR